ncbi:MAG: hydrogen gas-evolving membrane-bound hydrogenase subunit E [Candidatus Bipolaricaulota bacterium]
MKRAVVYVAFLLVAAFLLLAASEVHPFGTPRQTAMDDYFVDRAQQEVGANNVVTAIVFDYRGFDTLGEATVLFAAVVGVLIAFRALREDER